MASGDLCHSCDIGDIHHRVGRCLYVNSLGIFLHEAFHIFFIAVHTGKFNAIFGGNIVKETNTSAIQIRIHDQVIAGFEELHHHSDCCHTGRKCDGIYAILQRSDHLF